MKIRRADLNDLPELVEIGRQSMAEQDHLAPWDEVDGTKWIEEELTHGRVILALDDTNIAGTVGFHIEPYPWNRLAQSVVVKWFYVRSEYRSTRVAWDLADTLKIASKQMPVFFPVTWGAKVEAKTRLFRQMGFRQIGATFIIED